MAEISSMIRPNLLKSPRTPRPSSGDSPSSFPTRRTRAEEKHNLQTLNNRLELLLVGRKQADANLLKDVQRASEIQKKKMYELQETCAVLKAEALEARSNRDQLTKQLSHATESLESAKRAISEVENVCSEERQKYDRLLGENQKLIKKNASLASETCELKETNGQLNLDLSEEQDASTVVQGQLAASLEERQKLLESMATLKGEVSDAGKLREKLTEMNLEAEKLKKQMESVRKDRFECENVLRKEFTFQLNQILADRKTQFDNEKQSAIQDLTKVKDIELAELRAKAEELGELSKDQRVEIGRLKGKFGDFEKLREKYDTLCDLVKKLKAELISKQHGNAELVETKDRMICSLKECLAKKEALIKRISEINDTYRSCEQSYAKILDDEEERIFQDDYWTSPICVQKRKRIE
eukprot:557239_1